MHTCVRAGQLELLPTDGWQNVLVKAGGRKTAPLVTAGGGVRGFSAMAGGSMMAERVTMASSVKARKRSLWPESLIGQAGLKSGVHVVGDSMGWKDWALENIGKMHVKTWLMQRVVHEVKMFKQETGEHSPATNHWQITLGRKRETMTDS